MTGRILHIASWYPNPWNPVEGNFIRDHIRLFREEITGEAVVVQVKHNSETWFRLRVLLLDNDIKGYFLFSRFKPGGRTVSLLTTLLLLAVLVRHRAWEYKAFHVHIAIPLLSHVGVWRRFFNKPILVSEHWSAYHYNFNLPKGSAAFNRLRHPFKYSFPVLAVSQALLQDIKTFSMRNDFPGLIVPNFVPLHGASDHRNEVPVLFAVSRWTEIKDPLPMLQGLIRACESGAKFNLVIGGYGPLIEEMRSLVLGTLLEDRTRFLGLMTKSEIATQLASTDGYIFSSRYETFSVACAEALGAGVPLLGPEIPAIAEYAGTADWEKVEARDAHSWEIATFRFIKRFRDGDFVAEATAARASERFAPSALRASYRQIVSKHVPETLI